MCGISGYISRKMIPAEILTRMNNSMIHRGPDDAGVEVSPGRDGFTLGMAQRRLAILDLSPMGHQPMTSADGRVTIVYNGEIYNYREIEKKLKDYPFKSTCDTEMILAAYEKWGIDCISQFNGMFAMAIYDRDSQDLYLARDRFGVKPLYYWLQNPAGQQAVEGSSTGERGAAVADGLVFASELKPIMLCPGFTKRVRSDVVSRFLFQQYINAPDTIFEDVFKLSPGTILRFHQGNISQKKYWDTASVYHRMQTQPVTDYQEAKAELKRLLQRATALRMISDVPLGAFLSGGYDSSLVSALAQEQLGSVPLRTFSIGFHDERYNEAQYAKQVAQHLGCDHTELYIDEKDMLDLVESIPEYFDEPFADSSQIPTMLVSMLARQKVTVALSGDAGDEFFCGYNIYENVRQAQKLDRLGGIAHTVGRIGSLEEKYPFRVRVISANRNPQTKTQFGAGSYVALAQRMVRPCADPLPVNYEDELSYQVDNWQIRRMLLDMDTYLPGDIMTKVDRASMKYSLENRCPILDKDVCEYSYRMDHSFKYHNGVRKYILKDIAYDYIPKELLDRPKKGFSVPLDSWLRGPLKEQLQDYAAPGYVERQGIFDAGVVGKLVNTFLAKGDAGSGTGRNYSGLCWSYFIFQQWYQKYLGHPETI